MSTEDLSSAIVTEIYMDCVIHTDAPIEGRIEIEGVMHKEAFDPAKLDMHRARIEAALGELPDQFKQEAGGWSFINACLNRSGGQWADSHLEIERLYMLGLAIGKVICVFTRDVWSELEGGMPYFVVV